MASNVDVHGGSPKHVGSDELQIIGARRYRRAEIARQPRPPSRLANAAHGGDGLVTGARRF